MPLHPRQVILGLASFLFQRDMDLLIIAPLSHMNSLIIQARSSPAAAGWRFAELRRSRAVDCIG